MQNELEQSIADKMKSMLVNRQVPTERVLSWLQSEHGSGMWLTQLKRLPVANAYYRLLDSGEGFASTDIADLPSAHPMRVQGLNQHLRSLDGTTVELCGERFDRADLEVLILTAGKLSVAEIAARVARPIERVLEILLRLERRHFIVFVPH